MADEKSNTKYDTVEKLGNSGKIFKTITENQFELILTKGGKTFIDKIIEIRTPGITVERKKKLKLQIPGIAFQAHFRNGIRNKYHILDMTDELFIEEDGDQYNSDGKIIKFTTPQQAKEKRDLVLCKYSRFIKYAYDSVSQRNHYVVRVKGLTKDNFSKACRLVANSLGIVIDPEGLHVSRLAAFSYDPHAFINKKDKDYIDVSGIVADIKPKIIVKAQHADVTISPPGLQKFFTKSMADVHLTEFITSNKENIIFYPEGYIVCINKLPIIQLMGRKKPITEGERNGVLFRDFSLYVSLNGCKQSEDHLLGSLFAYNLKWCQPPLPQEEVIKIYNNVISRYADGELEVGAYERNGAFFSWCKLGSNERKALASSSRQDRNLIIFLRELQHLNLTRDEQKSLTIVKLAKKLNCSPQTVYNYQKKILEVEPTKNIFRNREIDRGSIFHDDIYELTINNILINMMGAASLSDIRILHPQLTIENAIKIMVDKQEKITKEEIAKRVGCSTATVKRSHYWKHYQASLKEYIDKYDLTPRNYNDLQQMVYKHPITFREDDLDEAENLSDLDMAG